MFKKKNYTGAESIAPIVAFQHGTVVRTITWSIAAERWEESLRFAHRSGGSRPRVARADGDGLGRVRRRRDATTARHLGGCTARARARACGAQEAGYIQARGYGSQCDAGCHLRWGWRAVYRVRRALRAPTLAHGASSRLNSPGSNARALRSTCFPVPCEPRRDADSGVQPFLSLSSSLPAHGARDDARRELKER